LSSSEADHDILHSDSITSCSVRDRSECLCASARSVGQYEVVRNSSQPDAADNPAPERMIMFLEEARIVLKASLSAEGVGILQSLDLLRVEY
jgi:hypothetical protein